MRVLATEVKPVVENVPAPVPYKIWSAAMVALCSAKACPVRATLSPATEIPVPATTSTVAPELDKPAPAIVKPPPAPASVRVQPIAVVPRVPPALAMLNQTESARVEPSSTATLAPGTSDHASKSVVRVKV